MLKSFYVLIAAMTWRTVTAPSSSDDAVIIISAKPTQQVRFDCTRPSDIKYMFWIISTSLGNQKIVRQSCQELVDDPIDVRKICIDTNYGYDLVITKVNEDDEGTYRCKTAKTEDALKVYDLRIEREAFIHDKAYTKDAVIQEGDTAKLWCNASGFPIPSVSWEISETDSNGKVSFHELGMRGRLLQIRNVSRHCSKAYRCIASNKLSRTPAIQNIKIRVNFGAMADIDVYSEEYCGTTMEDLGEKIHVNSSGDNYVEKREGSMVSLVCSGSGSPNAIIKWLKFHQGNHVEISTLGHGDQIDNNYQIGSFMTELCPPLFNDERRFRLAFRAFDDYFAKYVCRASNKFGSDEMTITIKQVT
ncbi:lachesin-like [Ylistrum balloti]|uniref:lachesin-like n=1 Tax=Ylistrum balloti TaxID=509963 RepID=UPI0029059375|nr:lachesin-like [Ylistrum balloti]